jgi:small GTP-binding protein
MFHHSGGQSLTFRGRVVVVGDASVGKTSLLNRLIDHRFDEGENSTIGANYQVWSDQIDDIHVELQIWDTAGQEKFRALCPIYFRNAIGALVVYDVTNRESFEHLDNWIKSFTDVAEIGSMVAIAGNKCDEIAQVAGSEAKEWANSRGVELFQVSAKTGDGVKEAFRAFTIALTRQRCARDMAPPKGEPDRSNDECSC